MPNTSQLLIKERHFHPGSHALCMGTILALMTAEPVASWSSIDYYGNGKLFIMPYKTLFALYWFLKIMPLKSDIFTETLYGKSIHLCLQNLCQKALSVFWELHDSYGRNCKF